MLFETARIDILPDASNGLSARGSDGNRDICLQEAV
jgi:hypothetical protein